MLFGFASVVVGQDVVAHTEHSTGAFWFFWFFLLGLCVLAIACSSVYWYGQHWHVRRDLCY